MDPLVDALRGAPYGVGGPQEYSSDTAATLQKLPPAIAKLVMALAQSGVDLSKRAIEGAGVYAQTGDPSQVVGPAAETAMNMFGVGGPAAMLRGGTALGAAGGRAKPVVEALGGALPEAKYAQYAEQYPAAGPPILRSKDKGNKPITSIQYGPTDYLNPSSPAQQMVDAGQAFWSKELTAEQKAFAKERSRIQQDMDQNGYTPYFDPAKRADVNPADYPTNLDMRRDAISAVPAEGKRRDIGQGVAERNQALFDNPEGRAALQQGFDVGKTIPESDRWYFMKQLQDKFIQEYGEEVGKAEFRKRFSQSMAATTGGMDPTSNYLMAHYGNYMDKQGLPFPQTAHGEVAAHQVPYPVGGVYAGGNLKMFDQTVRNPSWMGFDELNPKRFDFDQSFLGNKNAFTMDEQMTSGATNGAYQMPPKGSYGMATNVGSDLARLNNVDPRGFQDVGWAGLKSIRVNDAARAKSDLMGPLPNAFEYDGPMITHINDAIERTHRLTGMPIEEIVRRGVVRQEIPLYSGPAGPFGPFGQQQPRLTQTPEGDQYWTTDPM